MEVSLGFLDSPEQILIRKFFLNRSSVEEEKINIQELGNQNIDGLFLSKIAMDENTQEQLKNELKYFPIKKIEDFSLNDFKSMNPLNAISKLRDLNLNWVLKNNLILIENIFEIVTELKLNLHKDRDLFFENFWQIIKGNLGAIDLIIYFNDLEGEKKQIKKKKIVGKKYGEIREITEADDQIIKTFQNPSGTFLFFKEKEEFVINMDVLGSPIIIAGKCFSITSLQNSIIRSLFKGLE